MENILGSGLSLIIMLFSIVALVKSASIVENNLVLFSKKMKFDEFILGFIILAMATSLPEISVAVFASKSDPQVSLGNLVGATTVLLSLIIGATAVKFKSVSFIGKFKEIDVILGIFLILSIIPLLLDKRLSVEEGVFMLYMYIAYIFLIYRQFRTKIKQEDKNIKFSISQFVFIKNYYKTALALLILVLSAYFTVESATDLALDLGISETLVGLLVLGIGTNLPEITILILSKNKDQEKLALGNFFGSACINVGILGLLTILSGGFSISQTDLVTLTPSMTLLIITSFVFLIFSWTGKKLDKVEGIILTSLFGALILAEVLILLLYNH